MELLTKVKRWLLDTSGCNFHQFYVYRQYARRQVLTIRQSKFGATNQPGAVEVRVSLEDDLLFVHFWGGRAIVLDPCEAEDLRRALNLLRKHSAQFSSEPIEVSHTPNKEEK